MKTTNLVGRIGALALAAVCLFATTQDALGNGNPCPDCEYLTAGIILDFTNDEFELTIDSYANFDFGTADSVELLIEEGATQEWIPVSFVLDDIEYGIYEEGDLPTSLTGSGTEVWLHVYDSGSSDETFVEVRIQ
ncbi:MAG: hypothetical protein RIT81_09830 [Deltaproteobacteria bacterium]